MGVSPQASNAAFHGINTDYGGQFKVETLRSTFLRRHYGGNSRFRFYWLLSNLLFASAIWRASSNVVYGVPRFVDERMDLALVFSNDADC
jgi:hypothetical protein